MFWLSILLGFILQGPQVFIGTYYYHEHEGNQYELLIIDKQGTCWYSDGNKNFIPLKNVQANWAKNHLMVQFPNAKEIYHLKLEADNPPSVEWITPEKEIKSFFFYGKTVHVQASPQELISKIRSKP